MTRHAKSLGRRRAIATIDRHGPGAPTTVGLTGSRTIGGTVITLDQSGVSGRPRATGGTALPIDGAVRRAPGVTALNRTGGIDRRVKVVRMGPGAIARRNVICVIGRQATEVIDGKRTGAIARKLTTGIDHMETGVLALKASGKIALKANGKIARRANGEIARRASGKIARRASGKIARRANGKIARRASGKIARRVCGALPRHEMIIAAKTRRGSHGERSQEHVHGRKARSRSAAASRAARDVRRVVHVGRVSGAATSSP
jgi:hypothetical protein